VLAGVVLVVVVVVVGVRRRVHWWGCEVCQYNKLEIH
jgi:hypothetical protein